jgi:site-specific DNA-methyltransferase (adenine-specific)
MSSLAFGPSTQPDLASSLYYSAHDFTLLQGDSLELMRQMEDSQFDMIFADPPYFLSNGGMTCKNGRMVSVDKGRWDRSQGAQANHEFNMAWLAECQRLLKPNGTMWVSGTHHVIYSIGFAMQLLDFKILNDIAWFKVNPPPNLSCRYFTHGTETILWAAKNHKTRHTFNYATMKEENGGKQMKNLWSIMSPRKEEKSFGKHPTQKPIELLRRIILASTDEGAHILDPFSGSGTTGVTAVREGRTYVGLDMSDEYLDLSIRRYEGVKAEQAQSMT